MFLNRIDIVEVILSDWGDTGAETAGKETGKNLRQAMKEEHMPLLRHITCEFTMKKEREVKHS